MAFWGSKCDEQRKQLFQRVVECLKRESKKSLGVLVILCYLNLCAGYMCGLTVFIELYTYDLCTFLHLILQYSFYVKNKEWMLTFSKS